MVESRSMVRGPLPGPAPAAQARASSSRLTRSSCYWTWPHVSEAAQEGYPRVDGALTVHPSSAGRSRRTRITSASSMQSPPSQRGGHQRHHLVAIRGWLWPWGSSQVKMPVAASWAGGPGWQALQSPPRDGAEGSRGRHLLTCTSRQSIAVLLVSGWFSRFKNHYARDAREHGSYPVQHAATLIPSV